MGFLNRPRYCRAALPLGMFFSAAAFPDPEETYRILELLALRGDLFAGRRHLFRRCRVLLDHFVELLDRFVDLLGTGVLLVACGIDLTYQFRCSLDIGDYSGEHLACFFRNLYAGARELVDLPGSELASFRKLSYFRRDYGKSLSMLTGTGCLNGRV
jgi:hypothetical protein